MSTDTVATENDLQRAPGWRRALAGLIDAGVMTAIRRARRHAGGGSSQRGRQDRAFEALLGATPLWERIGTPGGLLMGLRTVDRRTGRPLAPWRVAVLVVGDLGIGELRTRLKSSAEPTDAPSRARAKLGQEVLFVAVGATLLRRVLTRRVAPTEVVLRRSGPHSP